MSERKYLDLECAYLIASKADVALFCRCGHSARVTPATWKKYPKSSLYRIVDKARCTECGAIGDVPKIRLMPQSDTRRTKH